MSTFTWRILFLKAQFTKLHFLGKRAYHTRALKKQLDKRNLIILSTYILDKLLDYCMSETDFQFSMQLLYYRCYVGQKLFFLSAFKYFKYLKS